MKTRTAPGDDASGAGGFAAHWKAETLGILALAAMAAWCLATSWRKWPDPIADAGTQWFVFWRLAHGAALYHDVIWNYGPLSAWFDGELFKRFGPGMMVLVTANLVFYTALVAVAYLAFRKAWGRLGAFAALAVFIMVFSFSRLNSIGNYNYATPYANEATHGMLLLLITVLITVWWCYGPSGWAAFFLGLCGGLAVVLKPEFMLACGLLGVTAFIVRWIQRQGVGAVEFFVACAGFLLPMLAFAARFAINESFKEAFIDANQAWWQVLVDRQHFSPIQHTFLGFNNPWANALTEAKATGRALVCIGAIWAAGWIANRPWRLVVRAVLVLAAGALVDYFRPELPATVAPGGWANAWLYVGACFPALMALAFLVTLMQAAGQVHQTGRVEQNTMMALALVLAAGAMLARMPLHARIDHLGFYQAALAGMVTAAFMVAEIPRWTGEGSLGRWLASAGSMVSLGIGCVMIAKMSYTAHAGQTVALGEGRDLFYCDAPDIDATGTLVKWTVDYLRTVPPRATVCVLPEGAMINYLSRRLNPVIAARNEQEGVDGLRRTPPDYVIFVPRDLAELGQTNYGQPGEPGYLLLQTLRTNNYVIAAGQGGDPLSTKGPKGVLILRHEPKPPPKPVPAPAAPPPVKPE
jgi:hypothetical protein